jgi:hypothetical protein
MSDLRERLATLCHEQWSGWMRYLFSKCVNPVEPDIGTIVIPKWAVYRWRRQMETPYDECQSRRRTVTVRRQTSFSP